MNVNYTWYFISIHRNVQYLSKRSEESTNVLYRLDCCPSETHFIHLRGGISREGKLVELYRNHRTLQKFYETSCKAEVLEKPCPLIEQKVQHLSRCVQRYSYVYAFIKDYNVSESYRLDYIRIKSGCSCQLEFSYPTAVELDSQSQLEGEEP